MIDTVYLGTQKSSYKKTLNKGDKITIISCDKNYQVAFVKGWGWTPIKDIKINKKLKEII